MIEIWSAALNAAFIRKPKRRQLNRSDEAVYVYSGALALTTNQVEQQYLRKRLLETAN